MKIADLVRYSHVFDLMLSNWYICIIAIAVFAVFFITAFKGFKAGFKFIILIACITVIALIAGLVLELIYKPLEELIALGVAWVPTIIFVLIILISTLVGIRRGLRKSLILLVHAVCAGGLCIGLYFFCVTSPWVDGLILDAVNAFMGQGGLQNALGVDTDCATLREVLISFICNVAGEDAGFLLAGSMPYLLTLTDLVYKIAFAVVFYILYFLLIFILYLVYLIFYSERKYKKNKTLAFIENKTDCTYRPHRIGGGVVGLVRGLAVALISFSFLGSALYIVAGTGDKKLEEYDFGSDNANFIYSIYRSVESYGSQGIYKILNSVKDPDDAPYYLFAADLVFSGGLDDEVFGIDENIVFRKEIGAYTGFARETFNLLLKYGEAELIPILNGESAGDMDAVIRVMSNEQFRLEFENLVDNFDAQTYFINFSLSLVNSIVENIDNLSFTSSVSEDNRDLLKILFKKNYLSDTIPDERALKNSSVSSNYQPPYISINKLFTKADVQIALKTALTFITGDNSSADALTAVKTILPNLEKLSIFDTNRSEEMNPVLGRLYCFLENKYLTEDGEDGITYAEVASDNINWGNEIRSLIRVSENMFTLYDNIKTDSGDMLDMVMSVFDEDNVNYSENIKLYDEICMTFSDSALIGKVLGSGFVMNALRTSLSQAGQNVYIPEKITFENKYNEEGALISYGETYQLFYGLRLLGGKENRELTDALLNSSSIDTSDLLDNLSVCLQNKDERGNSLSDYLTNSVLLRSVISSVMIEGADGVLAVPAVSLERDKNNVTVNLIEKAQLKQVFDSLPDIIDLIKPLTEGEISSADIANLLDDEALNSLIDSGNGIIEGTVAYHFLNQFGEGDSVIIPKKLESFENWVTFGAPGELRKFISAIKTMDIDFEKLIDGDFDEDEMFDSLNNLEHDDIVLLLNSEVMYYTVSDYLQDGDYGFGDFKIIIPSSSKVFVQNDTVESLIDKNELVAIFSELRNFDLNSDMNASEVVTQLVEHKQVISESKIIDASIVNYIVENDDVRTSLKVPESYIVAGSRSELENFNSLNVWNAELPALIDALDEIFGVSLGEQFDISEDAVSDKVSQLLKTVNDSSVLYPERSRLSVCYDSVIFQNNITIELDSALDGAVENSVLDEAKQGGYYKMTEIQALANASDALGLDYLELNGDEIKEKVKGEILTLNDKREDGQTTLELIYPSIIVSVIMTDEIDKALPESLVEPSSLTRIKGGKSVYSQHEVSSLVKGIKALGIEDTDEIADYSFSEITSLKNELDVLYESEIISSIITKQIDDGLGEDIIKPSVLDKIKNGSYNYPKAEVFSFIEALEELQLTSIENVESYDFSDIKTLNDTSETKPAHSRLDVLYDSNIVGGIITLSVHNSITDSDGTLADHERAYRSEIEIYNKSEIYSLVELLGGTEIEEYELDNVSVLRRYVTPDENGNVSYIITATLSRNLMENKKLVIPQSAVYEESLIKSDELNKLMDAFTALNGDGTFDDWDVDKDMVVPDSAHRQTIVDSVIMRATLTCNIIEKNSSGIVILLDNVETGRSTDGKQIAVINSEQLSIMFDMLSVCGDGRELTIPEFTSVSAISDMADVLPELYACDATRYRICAIVKNLAEISGVTFQTENAYLLESGDAVNITQSTQSVISYEDLIKLLEL